MSNSYIGYPVAYRKTLETIQTLSSIELPIEDSVGFTVARDIVARVDSPSAHTSLKDGYALRLEDINPAQEGPNPSLLVSGSVAAGQKDRSALSPGTAMRILTGAVLPDQADTIVAEEFAQVSNGAITVPDPIEKGRNILPKGSDASAGTLLMRAGQRITPGAVGLLAAGGCEIVPVLRKPHVAIIATGDEVLLPGQSLTTGKLYASNLVTLNGWCRHFGFPTVIDVVGDDAQALRRRLSLAAEEQDAIITSGGAWTSDKDMMARVLDALGWEKTYHRIRLGPGKAVGFGLLHNKPVFILPGGPPSNLVAFLELALPGLHKLCGHPTPGLQQMPAKLDTPVHGQSDWTQAVFGEIEKRPDGIHFRSSVKTPSRLKNMAEAQALLLIPEGISTIEAGVAVTIQLLEQH